jgi:hypothetical protein
MEGRIGNQHPIKKERHGLRRKSNLFKTRSWGIFYVTSYYLCIILLHVLVTLELLFYSFGDYVLIVSLKVELCLVSLYMSI